MNAFKRYTAASVTTQTTVHTAPALTQTTIIGVSVANTSGSPVTASVQLGAIYIVKDAPIPVGGALVIAGGDQKIVMEPADILVVTATDIVDVIASVLEIS